MAEQNNMDENDFKDLTPHKLKLASSRLAKACKELGVPIFISYYVPSELLKEKRKGYYEYAAVMPPEIDNAEVKTQTPRFNRFLEAVLGFKKSDYYIGIKKKDK